MGVSQVTGDPPNHPASTINISIGVSQPLIVIKQPFLGALHFKKLYMNISSCFHHCWIVISTWGHLREPGLISTERWVAKHIMPWIRCAQHGHREKSGVAVRVQMIQKFWEIVQKFWLGKREVNLSSRQVVCWMFPYISASINACTAKVGGFPTQKL